MNSVATRRFMLLETDPKMVCSPGLNFFYDNVIDGDVNVVLVVVDRLNEFLR